MKRVIVHIDRLVLDGYLHHDAEGIASGLREHLAHTFGVAEAVRDWRAVGHVARMRAPNARIEHNTPPRSIGANVARAISKGMKR